jgi:hypothetical protein
MDLADSAQSTFTNREIERLTAYRLAVAAGFYTDWDATAATPDAEFLVSLHGEAAGAAPVAYPFTAAEVERLERCRAAVLDGHYADDQPPAVATVTPEESAR